MITKTRRRYTEEFKAEVVRLIRDSARPVTQVARDVSVADHLLYRWRVVYPALVTRLRGNLPELLAFFHCPQPLWRKL